MSELPSSWVSVGLREVTEQSKIKINPLNIGKTRYVGLAHIDKDNGKLNGYGHSNEIRSAKSVFRKGDLLYGKLRPYLNKVWYATFDGICSTDLLVFSQNLVNNEYLKYRLLMPDFVRFANINVSGVHHPRVKYDTISNFQIPLPPLPEQQRIVAKIEELFTKLDAGVEALQKAKALLKQYRQSVLKAAVEGKLTEEWRKENGEGTEPASVLLERIQAERKQRLGSKYKPPKPVDTTNLPELPDGWVWASFGEIAEVDSDLINPTHCPDSIHIAPNHIEKFTGRLIETGTVSKDKVTSPKHRFKSGQILYSKIRPHLGKVIITELNGMCSADMYPINSLIHPHYLFRFMLTSFFINIASQNQGRTVLPKINKDTLYLLPVPVPPIEEQVLIVSHLERVLSIIEESDKLINPEIKRSQSLRQSILKRAFEGKLVPQDPADEPASELLERIRKEK